MAKREAFLIYGAWQEPIMRLSNESKGMLLVALLEYHNSGREIDLPIDVQMAFLFMKKQMDMDAEKYQTTCAKRAESGRKGGILSKQSKCKQMQANATKSKQRTANQADNDKENENDKEKDVVVETTTMRVATTPTTTKKLTTDELTQKLSHKFYVPGRSDAECRAALLVARKLPADKIVSMANGECDYDFVNNKPIYQFDREMDIAAGHRVWMERIVAQRTAAGGAK